MKHERKRLNPAQVRQLHFSVTWTFNMALHFSKGDQIIHMYYLFYSLFLNNSGQLNISRYYFDKLTLYSQQITQEQDNLCACVFEMSVQTYTASSPPLTSCRRGYCDIKQRCRRNPEPIYCQRSQGGHGSSFKEISITSSALTRGHHRLLSGQ